MREDRYGETHVSQYPKYFPEHQRERTLALARRLYDELEQPIGYLIEDEYGRKLEVFNHREMVTVIAANSYDCYIHELYGKNGYLWLRQAIDSPNTSAIIANSSKSLVSLSFKVGRKTYRLISSQSWGYGLTPTTLLLTTLREIFTEYGHGTHPTPSGLGHAGIVDWMRIDGTGKINRPNHMLRSKLAKYGSGGRADDFSLEEQMKAVRRRSARIYKEAWEQDCNNSYGARVLDGVPTDKIIGKGMVDIFNLTLADVEKYAVSFCQARITIPDGYKSKISPFYVREDNGLLEWTSKPGTYMGYWWYPMLKRCEDAGFKVEIGRCWCWIELDTFLRNWCLDLIALRVHYKTKGMTFHEEIVKGIIVSAIGRFNISEEMCTLVTEEHKQPEDEIWLNLEASEDEPLSTEYYIHKEIDYDTNSLNQVAQFIITMNNIELYDRMLAEELHENPVIFSNYDAIFTLYHPTEPIGKDVGQWKVKKHNSLQVYGLRSYDSYVDGKKVSKRPGVPLEGRKNENI